MNSAVITIRTDPKIKKQAQKIVAKLGISLSDFVNAHMKELIRTKTLDVSLIETPNAATRRALRQSKKDYESGRTLPYGKPQDALRYFDDLIANHEKHHKD